MGTFISGRNKKWEPSASGTMKFGIPSLRKTEEGPTALRKIKEVIFSPLDDIEMTPTPRAEKWGGTLDLE